MEDFKCKRCFRRGECNLMVLAVRTLPWVELCLRNECTEWELTHVVRRTLRGVDDAPGFIEDWIDAGAMTRSEADELVQTIVRTKRVDQALLCRSCRLYVGRAYPGCDDMTEHSGR